MDIQRNKAAMAAFISTFLLSASKVAAQVDIPTGDLQARWHPEPPPVLMKPCIVIDSVNNMTYMIGYDSKGALVFNFIQQSMCSANWSTATWTSLPYPGGGKKYHTEQCFLTATRHFAVQFEGGMAVWDHWARTWTYKNIPCTLTYPNNAALVYQNKDATLDDFLIHWQDSNGGHLTGVQMVNDNIYSCKELDTRNVPTDMKVAASPVDGKTFFLFGPKGSGWYDIDASPSCTDYPVKTTSDFHPLPALNVSVPRATNYDGSIYVFGKVPPSTANSQSPTAVPVSLSTEDAQPLTSALPTSNPVNPSPQASPLLQP
ncbi:hypothetical protein B0O80DRAFT_224897 [Mortierella sp. GBAus27b]|nr:hypothetical protein B0O80DRAFT_224897 [Mortierella sp. GBAus27b]